jgi:FkbM family methyltransferase
MEVSLRVAEMVKRVRRLLASRYLFDNWFSLLIRYALTRLGFNVKLTAKVNNCAFELSPEVFGCLVNGASRGLIKLIKCGDHDVFVVYTNDIQVLIEDLAVKNGWVYDLTNRLWFNGNVRFKHMRCTIFQVFNDGDYEQLNVKGRVVVDVGAYIGDSAIYFALKGAKKIIAIEPHPGAFAEMLDNIRLNNLEGVIIPVNAGLASRPGKMCIENIGVEATAVTYHMPGDCPITVPAMTLDELMDRFGVDPNDAVLKMDCEGCEFDVILNDYEHVRLFRELIFEYHPRFVNKSLDNLLNVLGRDYKCNIRGDKDLGIMHCTRK